MAQEKIDFLTSKADYHLKQLKNNQNLSRQAKINHFSIFISHQLKFSIFLQMAQDL